jgi:DnaJ-class molecular chaperone
MAARYSHPDKTWPFGRETASCPRCNGTGSDKQKVLDYLLSRLPPDRMTLAVNCDACDGRGRVLVEPVAKRA